MTFSFTFHELADLANFYVAEKQKSEKLYFTLHPYDDGIEIYVRRFKVSFITLKARFFISIKHYKNDELTLEVHFKNLLFELVKKIIFSIVLNILKKYVKTGDNGQDITKYFHFTSNTVRIEVNHLTETLKAPIAINDIKRFTTGIEINFTVKKIEDLDETLELAEKSTEVKSDF
jgi:hypothetical protein